MWQKAGLQEPNPRRMWGHLSRKLTWHRLDANALPSPPSLPLIQIALLGGAKWSTLRWEESFASWVNREACSVHTGSWPRRAERRVARRSRPVHVMTREGKVVCNESWGCLPPFAPPSKADMPDTPWSSHWFREGWCSLHTKGAQYQNLLFIYIYIKISSNS